MQMKSARSISRSAQLKEALVISPSVLDVWNNGLLKSAFSDTNENLRTGCLKILLELHHWP